MMSPTPILDVFAAVMLATAAVSGTRLAAAHLLTGVAMAGMLAPGLATLAPGAWETIFGALTGWFAWRAARDARPTGIRSLAAAIASSTCCTARRWCTCSPPSRPPAVCP
jgi:hypothetical protein